MSLVDERLWYLHEQILPAGLSLLPSRMNTVNARAMLLAIALQESGLEHRVQQPKAFAHGYWQFERDGGTADVLTSPTTRPLLLPILDLLNYTPDVAVCWDAIVHNDVLACICARLLLWLEPAALPLRTQAEKGLRQYLRRWRPKPSPRHAERWPANFRVGWAVAAGD